MNNFIPEIPGKSGMDFLRLTCTLCSLALISFGMILYEIVLTRIFAVILRHRYTGHYYSPGHWHNYHTNPLPDSGSPRYVGYIDNLHHPVSAGNTIPVFRHDYRLIFPECPGAKFAVVWV